MWNDPDDDCFGGSRVRKTFQKEAKEKSWKLKKLKKNEKVKGKWKGKKNWSKSSRGKSVKTFHKGALQYGQAFLGCSCGFLLLAVAVD